MNVFMQLGWFFKERKKQYFIGILMLLVVAVLQLLPPRIIGYVVDEIRLGTLTGAGLGRWLLILAGAALAMYVLRYYWRVMIFGSSVLLGRRLRSELFAHFTKMSSSFYQQRRVGDLMAHATNDIRAVQQTAGHGVLTLVDSVTTGGAVIIAMAVTIDWKLTLIALLPMPLMAVLTSWYGKLLHERFRTAQEAFSDLNDKTQESIAGIKVIKTFGQEKEDIEDFRNLSADVVAKNVRVARVDALFDPTISLIVGLSFFLSIIFGARFIMSGDMTLGDLIAFNAYLGLLVWPMLAFGFLFNIVERGRASYGRIRELLSVRPDIGDTDGAADLAPGGDITFDIREFRFPEDGRPALRDVRFTLKKGETLGIVGRTGSGKTAILKLLLREFEGYDGEITYTYRRTIFSSRQPSGKTSRSLTWMHRLIKSGKRPGSRTSMRTFSDSRKAMTRSSASGAFRCRAARSSASPSLAPCSWSRSCSSWMTRCPRWMPGRRRRFLLPSRKHARRRRQSSPPTG
ncbi:ABC transporter [Bhargavaea ginsengi]|uniref:ABC transporter n=1 Tax=Bhargavaea ginsengi TaxID=426757 RepID=A0A1H6WM38_9BACL|nr:ABC transporter [Bhargavaea ginsengi]